MHKSGAGYSLVPGALAFLAGAFCVQQSSVLFPASWLFAIPLLALAAWRLPALRVCLWGALGIAWAWSHAQFSLHDPLAADLEGQDVVVEGSVASLPVAQPRTRFLFDIDTLLLNGERRAHPARVQLTWFENSPELRAGERWRLTVRLKRPHGFSNPGGFDYEGWLHRQGIRATGYVRPKGEQLRLGDDVYAYPVQRARQQLADAMNGALRDDVLRGVLIALAIGEQRAITDEQWEVFTRTGTNHLVAISGLHVSMIALAAFMAVRWAWCRRPALALRWPGAKAGAVAGITVALGYAALAGFAVPTQRSVIMIAVVMSALIAQRAVVPAHTLAVALLVVLLWDPLAVLDAGFWLSYGAVALIFYGMNGRVAVRGWWWKWGRLHVLIAIGLTPLLLILFQRVSLISPLANFIAVPWVSFIVVPLTLIGAALLVTAPWLGEGVLAAAHAALFACWKALAWMASLDYAQWSQHVPLAWTAFVAVIGVAVMLAPRGVPGRWLGAVLCLPMLLVLPPRPAPGEAWLTLLDVGQGLSTVIVTEKHTLVYDTGPRFSPSFDTGDAVVAPFLRNLGRTRIDTLLVSHGDGDHVGGAGSLLAQVPASRVLTSVPEKIPATGAPVQVCEAGQEWIWDGVRFQILHPASGGANAGNNGSCVLRVSAGASALLPGDIEKKAERALVENVGEDLRADILIAPHHGSNTSSTDAFLAAVHPRYVLFPTGYRNRFGFPKKPVVERYEKIGAQMYESPKHGALTFVLSKGGIQPPRAWREEYRRYWHYADASVRVEFDGRGLIMARRSSRLP